jgi:AraC family transcriptional regulator
MSKDGTTKMKADIHGPPALAVNALNRASLSFTAARFENDSFTIGHTLRPHPFHELRIGGGTRPFYPFHSFFISLSRPFLDELAEDLESPRIESLNCAFPRPIKDPTLAVMARSILPYVESREDAEGLLVDHFMLAYGIYVCANYSNLAGHRIDAGCLTRWQERLAKEMIEAHLRSGLRLHQLAIACGLRTSQFAHAFRKSVGLAPYQWLCSRRIAQAKKLLRGTGSLADVALQSGFSDQSHFTRVFRRVVGVTPGHWRSQQ